jgi:hypothetical protein
MRLVLAFIGLIALGALAGSSACALEIQVAPQTLVVSSGGDNLTVHTNFPGFPPAGMPVILDITPWGGAITELPIIGQWVDDCGFYVVRCDRQTAADAVGPFDGKRTTAVVTLTILGCSGYDEIDVRK